jgi:DNA repair ATPase RecN
MEIEMMLNLNRTSGQAAQQTAQWLFLLIALVSSGAAANDDKMLAAFNSAADHAVSAPKGSCQTIPYDDFKDACSRKQDEVVRWCKKGEPYSCKGVDNRLKELAGFRDTQKARIDELSKEVEGLKSRKSQLTDSSAIREVEDKISDHERTIDKSKQTVEGLEKDIGASRTDIKERLYVGKNCLEARDDVNEIFDDVRQRAKGESNQKIRSVAQRLDSYWEATYRSHEDTIKETKEAVDACNRLQ